MTDTISNTEILNSDKTKVLSRALNKAYIQV